MCVHEKASDIIERAIEEACKISDGHEDGDILIEWALVAYVTNPNRPIENQEVYPVFYANGTMPTHRAVGLFQAGIDMTKGHVE